MQKLLQESNNFHQNEENLKKNTSKSGCHGNVKLDGQGLSTPNCSQLNFRKVTKFGGYSVVFERVING